MTTFIMANVTCSVSFPFGGSSFFCVAVVVFVCCAGRQLLDRRIKGKYHDRIASRISNWKKLARSFEFKVDDFDDELKKAEKIVKLLERWQQEEAENATFEALAKALENIEYPDDARQIRDLAMTVT